MKKWKLFLLALSVTALFSGCKKKAPETEAPTEPPTEIMTEAPATEAPQTEAPTEPPTEPEDSMNKTRSLKGLVKSSDSSTLTIQTERGKELTFTITGADIQLANGIQAGSNVLVMYKGSVNGDDTADARVLMITELQAGDTPVTEGEPMTEGEYADPEAGSGSIGGTIDDISTDRIVILADDGESYYFSLGESGIALQNGTQKGNYVTVDYTGDIYGPDLVPADRITDQDTAGNADAFVAPGNHTGSEYSYVNGVIEEYGVNVVSITSDEGEYLTFDTTNATQYYENGMAYGSYITIEYTGELNGADTTGVAATAVYEYSDDYAQTSSDDAAGDAAADNGAEDGGDDQSAEDGDGAAA